MRQNLKKVINQDHAIGGLKLKNLPVQNKALSLLQIPHIFKTRFNSRFNVYKAN